MNSTTTDALHTPGQQHLLSTIDNWKRKLLDVSKRNRSLNFKPLRVSTITIVDDLPEKVFSKLWISGANMRFAPSGSESVTSSDDFLEELVRSDQQKLEGQSLQFELLQKNNLEDARFRHHGENVLQTLLDDEKLEKSLRRLDELTRSAIDEQGVNILFLAFGMLHYRESADSDQAFQAPLVLLPVELSRKSSRTGYTIAATGDDPMVNPALTEYLRRGYGISIPELPDADSINEDYDLQVLLNSIRSLIERKSSWSVANDIHLALFSFQKLMMYKDLEQNLDRIASHRIIRQLVLQIGTQFDGLPANIKSLDLDQSLPPENSFQVVDADASQLRAIIAVANNLDLVMEGPPGTGKSQTITNLIALALASGRTVLFVAEKNAALKVVHQRLVKAGLGDFCLELHSTKANKRAVVNELSRSLDASLQRPTVSDATAQRLPIVREKLTEYVGELHKPFGILNLSPYQVIGRYDAVINAPRVDFLDSVLDITKEKIDQITRDLNELADAADLIGDPISHPWRDTSKTLYLEDDFEKMDGLCQEILKVLENISNLSAKVADKLGLPYPSSSKLLQDYINVANVVIRSPGAPVEVLSNALWNDGPPFDAIDLIQKGRSLFKRMQDVNLNFKPDVYDLNHGADIEYIQIKTKGVKKLFAIFDGRYREIRKQWLAYRLPAYQGSIRSEAEYLTQVDQINVDRKWLSEQKNTARQYFSDLWKGEVSNWDALESYVSWIVEFRKIYNQYSLTQNVIETAQNQSPVLSVVFELDASVTKLDNLIKSLGEVVCWPDNYLLAEKFEIIKDRVQNISKNPQKAHQWAAFDAVRVRVSNDLAGAFVKLAMDGQIKFGDLTPAFQRSFYKKWLAHVVQERRVLREFNTILHEQNVSNFKELDSNILKENRTKLIRKVRDDVQKHLQDKASANAMPFLRREIARQRGLSPLRKTIKNAGSAIRAIKPCFMMSPLTVSQLLDSSQPDFDLVIFDEASQLPAEDAIGAISRGKQLVVVGDPKQLPPTNFFSVINGQVAPTVSTEGDFVYEDGESILEELMASGIPTSRLKWHYRSAHEALIHFSNVSFYDGDLYTFPSVEFNNEDLGVSFEYVEDGLYEGKGLNLSEARRVVDAVENHAKKFPNLSLGIGTFNLRQQLAIQDEIENRRLLSPELDAFCSLDQDEPFFVKNLENIQGDERDVIFISVTYGKGIDGRLRYNFGPINGENGWRRLNVLASRARRRMKIFSSIHAEDINLVGLTSVGAKLLRDFLSYAERGQIDHIKIDNAADTESPFEREVYLELTRRGIKVTPQVGVAGYRIDFGIVDDDLPGRYICGIECDGVAYHSSETARDRDRLRQQVLEDRGWIIYRIWSTDWFKDRKGQIERILALIEKARAKSKEDMRQKTEQSSANLSTVVSHIQDTVDNSKQLFLDVEPVQEGANNFSLDGYTRPIAAAYQLAKINFQGRRYDILDTSIETIAQVADLIAQAEEPIHIDELVDRIVSIWETRAGRKISAKVRAGCDLALRRKLIVKNGNFFFKNLDKVTVRSRSGLKFDPEHIAPEEYRAAVLMVLQTGCAFPRNQLANEVRSILGYGRTTSTLDTLINKVIDELLAKDIAGDASNGITLRQ